MYLSARPYLRDVIRFGKLSIVRDEVASLELKKEKRSLCFTRHVETTRE